MAVGQRLASPTTFCWPIIYRSLWFVVCCPALKSCLSLTVYRCSKVGMVECLLCTSKQVWIHPALLKGQCRPIYPPTFPLSAKRSTSKLNTHLSPKRNVKIHIKISRLPFRDTCIPDSWHFPPGCLEVGLLCDVIIVLDGFLRFL